MELKRILNEKKEKGKTNTRALLGLLNCKIFDNGISIRKLTTKYVLRRDLKEVSELPELLRQGIPKSWDPNFKGLICFID